MFCAGHSRATRYAGASRLLGAVHSFLVLWPINRAYSSTIRARRERLPPLPRFYGEAFFAELRGYLPHLRLACFAGGELFLIAENFRVWDMLREEGLDTACHITTNGTVWNAQVEQVLERLNCHLSISMDGATRETFEHIRVGARWDTFMANFRRFRAYSERRDVKFTINLCLLRHNWHEFAAVLQLAEEEGCAVVVNTVLTPAEHSLYTLPPAELSAIVQALDQQSPAVLSRLKAHQATWSSTLQRLRGHAAAPDAGMHPQPR